MVERMLDDLQQTEPIIRMARGLFAERYMDQRRSLERTRAEPEPARERFGYVIVDEAQGLSAMQWRMISRRCPSGRMTVLGDLGQAASSAAPDSWDGVLAAAGASNPTVAELTINYRTPAEIMDLAARVLALAAPGLAPPRSVRSTGEPPVIADAAAGGVARAAVEGARAAHERLEEGRVAIVTSEALVAPIAAALELDIAHLDAAGLLDAPVTVLAVDDARGLEFDAVVVAEPQDIVDESPGGLRALYVAMTRPTQTLVCVISRTREPLRSVLARSPTRSGS
jgi:DNA helicase IV